MAAAGREALRRFGRQGFAPGSAGAFLFAVACAAMAALAHIAFAHFYPEISPSILYNSAVFVTALFAGFRAGLAAIALGAASLWWGFRAGYFGAAMTSFAPALALYLFAAMVILCIAQRYRSSGTENWNELTQGPQPREALAHSVAPTHQGVTSQLVRAAAWLIRPNSLPGYMMALVLIVLATLIRTTFERLGGEMLPLVSYYPAVLLAALIGGLGAGLLAMVLSLFAVWWEYPAPLWTWGPVTREESFGLSLYVFFSLLTVWLAENRRRVASSSAPDSAIFHLLTSMLVAFAAVLLATFVLLAVDTYLAPDHLVLGYLLPTVIIAMHYGGTLAVITAFVSGIAAAYFLFPPKFSFYIADPLNMAELGFFLLLAIIASKAVAVLTDGVRNTRDRERRRFRP